ncbi:MAG: hypothetical protein WDZ35_04050 [Crocinitomicaceae bacterium]
MKRVLLILLLTPFVFTACSTEDAQKVADEFHQKLNAGEINHIVNQMLDNTVTEKERLGFEEYLSGLHQKGKHENRQKTTSFNKSIKNGVTTVKLGYTFEVGGELVHEKLVLVDRGEGYKIIAVSMHPKKEVVDEFTAAY